MATAAGQVGTALLRLTPGVVSRMLHTPAPVLQIPAGHRIAGRTITVVTPGLVRRAHALGKHVHVWFHSWSREDATEMHRLLDLGVDGIVTDHIDVLRDVLAERGHPLHTRVGLTSGVSAAGCDHRVRPAGSSGSTGAR